MKKGLLFTGLLICGLWSVAQDSIRARVILIGDAGELNKQQQAVLQHAALQVIKGKTTVLFLGDNIYPNGMALPGHPDSTRTQGILKAQFEPIRAKDAAVYFIPGNHDWDKMGSKGLIKIQEQSKFLERQNDPMIKLLPANGCPDPEEINVSDNLVIIAWDSEWWLFPYEKNDPDAGCRTHSKTEVIERMQELLYKNRDKTILLASHHPFRSYGIHGGYFSLKDHLFPLTAANKNLYIPLPVIGSLYPLLRTSFVSPEEAGHPLYKDMVKQVNSVFEGFPNLVHVAGHEHGLQLISSKEMLQVVSGSGAKNSFVKKGKDALFVNRAGGYVTADLLSNNNLRLTYYVSGDSGLVNAFTYTKPFTDLKLNEALAGSAPLSDSIAVSVHPAFDSVGGLHRRVFGENYRKEWATPATLPVIKLSQIKGGLIPIQRGGGFQSKSLRLKDKAGKEWVLRSVNKYPEKVLPEAIRETFVLDVFTDAMSAQHPYSALIVPVIANAAGVPHASPVIGYVAPDTVLGIFEKDFAGTVCLLEEREPIGKTDNTGKMLKELINDNDNSFDTTLFFKARLLDVFIGDWDRHEDQWRWAYEKEGKNKRYKAVPRDRDQVFHVMEGTAPSIASRKPIAPHLHNFDSKINKINEFFTSSNELNKQFLSQMAEEEWMRLTHEFTTAMTDSVLEAALQRLPAEAYQISHDKLLRKWKERRVNMGAAMNEYYRFLNRIVDLQTSDKNEFVSFTDAPDKGLEVSIHKISKKGNISDLLFRRVFYPDITREIRLYVYKGDDSILINNHSPINIRIIGKKGEKVYHLVHSDRKVKVYGKTENVVTLGNTNRLAMHLSSDSANTAYVPTNPYNKVLPLLNAGYNQDNGFLLGLSVKFTNQGFRKKPYGSMQQVSFLRAFSTSAYNFTFHSEWLHALGKADILTDLKILAPDNTQNFFGVGNNTVFNKTGDYIHYYRTTFSQYEVSPALRWRNKDISLTVGPTIQYYRFDDSDNTGRLIKTPGLIGTYDSATIDKEKLFGGIRVNFIKDGRNNALLPTNGVYARVGLQAYSGLNNYSKSFIQITPEIIFYKSIDKQSAVVIANRLGGGITVGKTAFYQSLFLGGHENLLGYRQFRFAGQYMLYNNLEARIKIAQIGSYILPGQLGLLAFYDAGKVWQSARNSSIIHQGVGGGLYFAPAQMAVLQFVAGYSKEGWYPYVTLGFRF